MEIGENDSERRKKVEKGIKKCKQKKTKNNFYELWYAICWNEWRLACANACLLLFTLSQYLNKSTWCYFNIFNNGNRTRITQNEYDQRKCLNIEHYGTKWNDDDDDETKLESRNRKAKQLHSSKNDGESFFFLSHWFERIACKRWGNSMNQTRALFYKTLCEYGKLILEAEVIACSWNK